MVDAESMGVILNEHHTKHLSLWYLSSLKSQGCSVFFAFEFNHIHSM